MGLNCINFRFNNKISFWNKIIVKTVQVYMLKYPSQMEYLYTNLISISVVIFIFNFDTTIERQEEFAHFSLKLYLSFSFLNTVLYSVRKPGKKVLFERNYFTARGNRGLDNDRKKSNIRLHLFIFPFFYSGRVLVDYFIKVQYTDIRNNHRTCCIFRAFFIQFLLDGLNEIATGV